MVTKQDKNLTIHELEYSHILNKQNIFLGLIGAFILTILSNPEISAKYGFDGNTLVIILITFGFFSYIHFSKRLEEITEEIKILEEK